MERGPLLVADVDGDGSGEVVLGQPTSGRVLVWLDGVASSDAPDVTLSGGVGFGRALSAGDLDGDGRADLLVASEGLVSLHLGEVGGPAAEASWDVAGDDPTFGEALALGDVDDDGLADLLVGAPRSGRVWIASGVPGGLAAEAHIAVEGAEGFGAALALGDVDADGRADLLVGVPTASPEMPEQGHLLLFPGATMPAVSSWQGAEPRAALGASVAMLDINGDGRDELLAGAPGTSVGLVPNRGAVSAYAPVEPLGESELVWATRVANPALERGLRRAGSKLSVGDIDGDGRGDLVVFSQGGVTAVYAGADERLTPFPALLLPAAEGGALGDVDGDGLMDPVLWADNALAVWTGIDLWQDPDGDGIVSARDCRPGDPAYAYGRPEACDQRDSDCDGSLVDEFFDEDGDGFPDCIDPELHLDFAWLGTEAGDVVALGDVNGDGQDDILVTSRSARQRFDGEGLLAAYHSDRLDPFPEQLAWGGATDVAIDAVSSADVDGDGFDDVVVGIATGARVYQGTDEGLGPWFETVLAVEHPVGPVLASDLDGDGLADVIVGDSVDGGLSIWSAVALDGPPRWRLSGSGAGASSLVNAGDADGDGLGDVLVGASGAGASLVFGSVAEELRVFGLEAPWEGVEFGASVAALGDVDGDGRIEVAVGDPGDGSVALFAVGEGEPTYIGAIRAADAGFARALTALDWNADGHGDLAVGAPAAGLVKIYLGGPYGLATSPVAVLDDEFVYGTEPGGSLASGQVDDRSGDDLLVGDSVMSIAWLFRGREDADADGLIDAVEWGLGLDPSLRDTDGDGYVDGLEVGDPAAPLDTDADGILDALDLDSDADGVADATDNCPRARNPGQEDSDGDGIGDACSEDDDCEFDPDDGRWRGLGVTVTDLAPAAGFQGNDFGHFNRGRALVSADFDLDGQADFFVGNPGDESYVLRATHAEGEPPAYEMAQLLLDGDLAWAASSADYDNDGDYDLYVSGGGNECLDHDHLFRNMVMETGEFFFQDVTDIAGIAGWLDPLTGRAVPTASGNGAWGDVDRDGDVDLFVSTNNRLSCGVFPRGAARNILWLNNGDGTFTDVTAEMGLLESLRPSRHSAWVDYDNDGDLDLYENNHREPNILWRSLLVETGRLSFVDATGEVAGADGSNVAMPLNSFAACVEDFDNDGWQDLIAFNRSGPDCSGDPDSPLFVDGAGHRLFINQRDGTFSDVGMASGLSVDPVANPERDGVMGCQLGDLNADGVLDVYIGNGGPRRGEVDQLFISDSPVGASPTYIWSTPLIDWPALDDGSVADFPPYPYRTHGTTMVDVDNDGLLELAVVNGGPDFMPDHVREPNRLFDFDWEAAGGTFRVRPVGDGVDVSRDAIGTRMALTVRNASGEAWTLHRTLSGGNCFSAQNGFEVFFGVGDAVAITRLELHWPNGASSVRTSGLAVGESVVVSYP